MKNEPKVPTEAASFTPNSDLQIADLGPACKMTIEPCATYLGFHVVLIECSDAERDVLVHMAPFGANCMDVTFFLGSWDDKAVDAFYEEDWDGLARLLIVNYEHVVMSKLRAWGLTWSSEPLVTSSMPHPFSGG